MFARGSASLAIAVAVLLAACTSSSGGSAFDPIAPGCPTNYDCTAGQTCWSPQAKASQFICVASGSIAAGGACPSTSSVPVCADRLGCYGDGGQGRCVYYCDASHACPSGAGTCTQFNTVNGYSLTMCL